MYVISKKCVLYVQVMGVLILYKSSSLLDFICMLSCAEWQKSQKLRLIAKKVSNKDTSRFIVIILICVRCHQTFLVTSMIKLN